jgi:N-acetylglucosaminyldiphosphoundecaprenol N-acetyl-beta-D-mannosaminyltransferase
MSKLIAATRSVYADIEPPQPQHAEFLGLRFYLSSQAEALKLIIEHSGAPYRYAVTPNAYDIVSAHNSPERMLPIFRGAWLSVCDSRIVRALSRLEGRSLPLITGSDLTAALLSELNGRDWRHASKRVLIVGPPRGTETALRALYPDLNFEILSAPSALSQNADLRLAVARACLNRQWDIALLCVGFPAQGLIAQQLADLGCKSGVALCVGASIDFLTGVQIRAPRWMQRLGLEWAYRLATQPRRLWRRYLIESPKIAGLFLKAQLARMRNRDSQNGTTPQRRRDTPA